MTTPSTFFPGSMSATLGDAGVTSLISLRNGLPTVFAAARRTRDHKGVIPQLCERHTLKRGTGENWIEPVTGRVEAHDIAPDVRNENPQQIKIVGRLVIRPTAKAVQIMMPDDVAKRLDPKVYREMGQQGQMAVTRKQDIDGFIALNSAGTTYGSAGSSFDFNSARSGRAYGSGNAVEPAMGMYRCVAHAYQLLDIENALTTNIGAATYGETSSGMTAEIFRKGWMGNIGEVKFFEGNNIPINANDDAYAPLFPREAAVLVMDDIMSHEIQRDPNYGEGANIVHLRSKYAFGLRNPSVWVANILSDCSAPS
jgi:hypothetical protein